MFIKLLYIHLHILSLHIQYGAGPRLLLRIITPLFKDQSIIVSAVTPQSFSDYCTCKDFKYNQQIKELQAAYKNRNRFSIRLNGTYAKLKWSGTSY